MLKAVRMKDCAGLGESDLLIMAKKRLTEAIHQSAVAEANLIIAKRKYEAIWRGFRKKTYEVSRKVSK